MHLVHFGSIVPSPIIHKMDFVQGAVQIFNKIEGIQYSYKD